MANKEIKMRKISAIQTKPLTYYKGIRIKADIGLHEQLEDIILKHLKKTEKILDFGCGEGALSQRLKDDGYQVYSVDINAKDFKAETEFEMLDFNNADMVAQFYERHHEEFSMVIGVEVIEHVENPWQYIRDLKSLVKPGGYILLSTPNITSWYSRIRFLFYGRFHQFNDVDREYGHINPIALDELEWIGKGLELELVEKKPGGWLPRIWFSRSIIDTGINLLGSFFSLFMKGIYDGWCIITLFRKPDITGNEL